MASANVLKRKVFENSSAILTCRLVNALDNGTALVPADVDSMTIRSFRLNNGYTILIVPEGEDPETYEGTTLDPNDVILDALDTTYLAEGDSVGVNLVIPMHGSFWPEGDRTYRVVLDVVPVSGDPYTEVWEVQALQVVNPQV